MILLDIGPPEGAPDRARWMAENRGPALINVDDNLGAEMHERDPARYLRQDAHGREPGWGRMDAHGGFVPSGIEPVDPEITHRRGTVIGEQLARERREGLIP